MFKMTATAAALAAFAASSAMAQTAGTLNAGLYQVTTEYTAVTDPNNVCTPFGVVVGGYTTGVASVFGNGKVLQTIVPVPTPASGTPPVAPFGVANLTCNYTVLPKVIAASPGTTPYTGTTTCSEIGVTSTITGGSNTINTVLNQNKVITSPQTIPLNTANSFHITSTGVTVTIGTNTCTVSTDALFTRTGS